MTGLMCWASTTEDEPKILYLQTDPRSPWQVYNTSPHAIPDYDIPNGSKGFATYQKLRKLNWTLVPTPASINLIQPSTIPSLGMT